MSGKTTHLKRLAAAAKAENILVEQLTATVNAEEELLEIQKVSE